MATAVHPKGSPMRTHTLAGRRPRRRILAVSVAAAALTVAGCSSDSSGAAPGPIPTANGDAVSAQATSLGSILVDGRGRTVYEFANDTGSTSTCTGSCASVWLPVSAPATLPASEPGVTGKLGSTTRSDGTRQLTVAGHPVYTFTGDSAAGQTTGQNVVLNGGLWTVVSPAGAPVRTAAASGNSGPSY
jgi:predicted lipoprotein with Yx(FWY)xxD motif